MALQEQLDDEVVTVTAPVSTVSPKMVWPGGLNRELVGEMVEAHVVEPFWVTVKVRPPMVMVPVLVFPVVLADTK